MIKCQDVDSVAQAFLDGETSPEDHISVQGHLLTCPRCTGVLAERVLVTASLAEALGREVVPDGLGITAIIHGDETIVPDDPFAPTVAGEDEDEDDDEVSAVAGEAEAEAPGEVDDEMETRPGVEAIPLPDLDVKRTPATDAPGFEKVEATTDAPLAEIGTENVSSGDLDLASSLDSAADSVSTDSASADSASATPRKKLKRKKKKRPAKTAGEELVGVVLGGYQIIDLLAKGGMGTVYRAKQLSMERVVALKVLSPRLAAREKYVKRFLREARAAAALEHPNLVRIYDIGEGRGLSYYSMEFIEGESLADAIKTRGALPQQDVISIGAGCARALEHARSQGIAHRDIKPPNILLRPDGQVFLADLGLAKWIDAEGDASGSLTSAGTMMGSPNYMSPEQARDPRSADHVSDIYALGATLYHAATGEVPHRARGALEVIARLMNEQLLGPEDPFGGRIPPALRTVLRNMVSLEREDRIQTAEELTAALDALRRGEVPRLASGRATGAPVARLTASPNAASSHRGLAAGTSSRAQPGSGARAQPGASGRRRPSGRLAQPASGSVPAAHVARPRGVPRRSSGAFGFVVAAAVLVGLSLAFLWALGQTEQTPPTDDGGTARGGSTPTPNGGSGSPLVIDDDDDGSTSGGTTGGGGDGSGGGSDGPDSSTIPTPPEPAGDLTEDELLRKARELVGADGSGDGSGTGDSGSDPDATEPPDDGGAGEATVADGGGADSTPDPIEPDVGPSEEVLLASRIDASVRDVLIGLGTGPSTDARTALAELVGSGALGDHAQLASTASGVLDAATIVAKVRDEAWKAIKKRSDRGGWSATVGDPIPLADGSVVDRGRVTGTADNPHKIILTGGPTGYREVFLTDVAPGYILTTVEEAKAPVSVVEGQRARVLLALAKGDLGPAKGEEAAIAAGERGGDLDASWRLGFAALLAAQRTLAAELAAAEPDRGEGDPSTPEDGGAVVAEGHDPDGGEAAGALGPPADPADEKALLAMLATKDVKRLPDGRWEIVYDFSDPAQRRDWEIVSPRGLEDRWMGWLNKGRFTERDLEQAWTVPPKQKALFGLGWKRLAWRHQLLAGMEAEVRAEAKGQNAAITMFEQLGENRDRGREGGPIVCAASFQLDPFTGRNEEIEKLNERIEPFGHPQHVILREEGFLRFEDLAFAEVGKKRPRSWDLLVRARRGAKGAYLQFFPEGDGRGKPSLEANVDWIAGGGVGLATYGKTAGFNEVRIRGHIRIGKTEEERRRWSEEWRKRYEEWQRGERERAGGNGGGEGEGVGSGEGEGGEGEGPMNGGERGKDGESGRDGNDPRRDFDPNDPRRPGGFDPSQMTPEERRKAAEELRKRFGGGGS